MGCNISSTENTLEPRQLTELKAISEEGSDVSRKESKTVIKKYQSQKIYNPYVPENSENLFNDANMKRKKSEKVKKFKIRSYQQ